MDLDLKLFLLINQLPHSRILDSVMLLISRGVPYLILAFFLILIYLAFISLRDFREVFFLFFAFLIGFLLVGPGLKDFVARPRPSHAVSQVVLVEEAETDYSFPSVHSFLIALLAVLVARKKDRLLSFFLPLSFLVGFSRIYLGVHYPSDVLVGLGLGFLYGLLINFVIDRFLEHRIFNILKFHVENPAPRGKVGD